MKTVLVTGGSRGIGAAIAEELKKSGYNVVITYFSNSAAAEKISERLGITALKCDAADKTATERAVEEIHSRFGRISVLVNNAGYAPKQGIVQNASDDEYEKTFGVNMRGAFNAVRAVADDMVFSGGGSIVNVASVWGLVGGSCEAVYSASKGAVIAFTKALAAELGPSGVRVNAVAPGIIATDMNAHLSRDDVSAFCERVALGRQGTPEEVARAVRFLCSDDASYITGAVLTVDGGIM